MPNAEDDKARDDMKDNGKINKNQVQALTETITKAEIDMKEFLNYLEVKSLAGLTTKEFIKASNIAGKRLQKKEKEKAENEKPKEIDVAKMGEPVGKPDKLNAYDELKQASELQNVKL